MNLARIESTRIENEAAAREAERLDLNWVFNANPDDVNTTPPCRRATDAGVIPLAEMLAKYGAPPRLDEQYHLCRSLLVYVRPEWVEDF